MNNSSSDKIIQKALNSLARLYTNEGSTLYDYNKALSCLNESVAISKNFDAYTMLGGIYSDKMINSMIRKKQSYIINGLLTRILIGQIM